MVPESPSSSSAMGAHLADLKGMTDGFVGGQAFSTGRAATREDFQSGNVKVYTDSFLMK